MMVQGGPVSHVGWCMQVDADEGDAAVSHAEDAEQLLAPETARS